MSLIAPAAPSLAAADAGARRILLVDDDADVLQAASLILRRAGHTVATATSGEEGLGVLAMHGPFGLLVTDHAMPGLSGLAFARQARARMPELPVLLMSGYSRDYGLADLPAGIGFLAKPFTRRWLLDAVAALLGPAKSGAATPAAALVWSTREQALGRR